MKCRILVVLTLHKIVFPEAVMWGHVFYSTLKEKTSIDANV